jgi:SsrA-binding protein
MKIICQNKKASFEYFILDTYEAGIKLTGTEIKSIRANKCNINDSYAIIKNGKIYILNMHISKYDYGTYYNHDETRTRELLMHQNEITKLFNRARLDGETLIPLRVYLKEGLCKIEIGVCKGKNKGDKREALKAEDARREARKALKDRNHF